MADNRKKTQQPLYKDPGWGDSVSVSKKAREELAEISNNTENQQSQTQEYSQKKTAQLKDYSNYSNSLAKKTDKLAKSGSNIKSEVNTQVEHLNKEINKAVSEIENVFSRFLNQLSSAISNFFLAGYNLLLRILLLVFVEPVKNIGKFSNLFLNLVNDSLDDFNNWLSGSSKPKKKNTFQESSYQSSPSKQKTGTASLQQPAPVPEPKEDPLVAMQRRYPAVFDGIVFGELAKKGIVFLNIKNTTLYDENKTDFTVEEEQELLDRGIKEINNCARLAKNLPSPTKGRYVSRPMEEILENAGMNDLKAFLQYVYTHPKPFIERRLRLSEAFATWAHKGAPV